MLTVTMRIDQPDETAVDGAAVVRLGPTSVAATVTVDVTSHADATAAGIAVASQLGGRIVRTVVTNGRTSTDGVPDLVGVSEIATIKGCSRQYASQVASKRGFPAPVAELKSGPVWEAAQVHTWLADHTR